jgi:glycosyltransferase involved in cell wall biosynthesis
VASAIASDSPGAGASRARDPGVALHPLASAPPAIEVSVVIPLLNEEQSLRPLYEQLAEALEADYHWEAVFVDDGSTDGSYRELVRLHDEFQNVRVVQLRRNFGKAAALAAGFDLARGEVVVTIDADLQDDPAEIPRLIAKLDEGFDLVSGWKLRRRDSVMRRAASRLYNRTTGWVTGVRLRDMNCGLKAYRAELTRDLRLYGELHRYVPVLAHHRGFRVSELPVNHRAREHGRSRYGPERFLRGFFDLLTVAFMGRYRNRPLHLFGGLGLATGFAGTLILLYLTAIKIAGAGIGQRPLLLLGALLVVVGIQLLSLGLVGEMITSNHAEKASRSDRANHVRNVLD